MFIDKAKLTVKSGKGGDGAIAFHREKFVERGGPSGGNGGRGGSIYFVATNNSSTLINYRHARKVVAKDGEKGMDKKMYGRKAEDIYLEVPVGTVIYDDTTGRVIGDITAHKQEVLVAKGGRGGRGNMAFATGIIKCPDYCEKGEPGEKKVIRCELKILADCGLVGFPSVGKSTLISAVSAARPKIAAYHFTTIVPNLGMVEVADGRSFVMADLPGIIEGAHQGAGLGLQFLRHIERCRVIVHIIDMAATDGRDPYEDYVIINKELESYKMNLSKRPMIIVANKMDQEEAKANLIEFKKKVDLPIIEISAYTKQNLNELLYKIADTLDVTDEFSLFEEDEIDEEVEYGYVEEKEFFHIEKQDDGVFNCTGDGLKRLFDMTDFNSDSGRYRFARQLRSYGLDDALRKLGVKNGDIVRIFDYEFEFID